MTDRLQHDREIEKRWNAEARKALKGRTIKSVRYMSKSAAKDWGWYDRGIVMMLDNGVEVIVSQDDEGNGPGALFVAPTTTLPVIR